MNAPIPGAMIAALLACLPLIAQEAGKGQRSPAEVKPSLTDEELSVGWQVLFDGETTEGWRGYQRKDFPDKGWVIEDGTLHLSKGGGGDLITTRRYANFELRLSWKVAARSNSGILYRVSEDEKKPYWTGPEYQIFDDGGHKMAAESKSSSGALYALYSPRGKTLKPVGGWNTARIIVDGTRIEHWLNGKQVVAANFGSEDWQQRIAKSKFNKWKRFATIGRGHICLQDHGNKVWYRDIMIRELPPAKKRMGKTVSLFDAKSFGRSKAQFKTAGQLGDAWSLNKDGNLICKGNPRGYIYTPDSYENFILELDWRFDPEKKPGNSGVLLRVNGEHKVWPRSIEAQLFSGRAGDIWNIGKFGMQVAIERTKGRRTLASHYNEKPLGGWNRYKIIVDGSWVQLSVNGEVLNEAWDCEQISGPIGLQSEGAEIQFRNVRVTPLL